MGEKTSKAEMKHVTLERLPDDPVCLRVSIGGKGELGYYCQFRGDQTAIIDMIETVLLVLRYAPQLEIERDMP